MDDFGLPVLRKPDARYVVTGDKRPWTPGEDNILSPFLLACGSAEAYNLACRWLCKAVGHAPAWHPESRPTEQERAAEEVALIEMRTVTRHLSGTMSAAFFAMSAAVRKDRRAGRPLSWAEKMKFLRPHARKPKSTRPKITDGELLHYLERPETELKMVKGYVERAAAGRVGKTEPEDESRPRRTDALIDLVRLFANTPADNPGRAAALWAEICHAAEA